MILPHFLFSLNYQARVGGAAEVVLWEASSGEPLPEFDGFVVFLPQEVSKVSRFQVHHAPSVEATEECGFTSFLALFDANNDLLVASIDDFLAPPVIDGLVSKATGKHKGASSFPAVSSWAWAHIHPDARDPSNLRKGNGFPGLRVDLDPSVTHMVARCLAPVMAVVDPKFSFQGLKDTQTL